MAGRRRKPKQAAADPEESEEILAPPGDVAAFTELGGVTLRAYQIEVARAIIESVMRGRGLTFVVMFPRQSGKNELQAQIEVYLLAHLREAGGEIVKISPTLRPQSQNAMRRLERVLARSRCTADLWSKESGYIYRVGDARVLFFSGSPEANIVGATASTLLEVDEAQSVRIDKFDRDIAPMAASTNATRVFWGTAWTSRTLLARELRAAQEAERAEAAAGQPVTKRAFVLTASDVARALPAYGEFVAGQVARLGRNHPMVKTQYFSEEIDGEGGMFPPARLALMQDANCIAAGYRPGSTYAVLLDVAGEDEAAGGDMTVTGGALENPLSNRDRDCTALTVVEVDRSTLADPLLRAPTYRVVERRQWQGVKHARIYGEVRALAEAYRARWVVVDATGVGAGLASFLERALPGRVIPFLFSQASKSRLGWGFLGIVDAGRWKDPAAEDPLRAAFFQQLGFCQYSIRPGPTRVMRWGVPDGTRDPASGQVVHDDLVLSAALAAVLDEQPWVAPMPVVAKDAGIIRAKDPLEERFRF